MAASFRPIAIAIMAKDPHAGDVKTRLSAALSPQQRTDIYTAFLSDKIDQVLRVEGVEPCIAFTPETAEDAFRSLAGERVKLVPQRGPDLGARLDQVATDLLAEGFGGVVLVDSDTPNLPTDTLREAIGALRGSADVVLGPAWDGGYYLIGIKAQRPELFSGIAWSTPSVLRQTLEAAARQKLRVHVLRSWFDVDTPADLDRLARQLDSEPDGSPDRPKRSAALLSELRSAPVPARRNQHWTTLAERPVYENRWIRVDENLVRTAAGHVTLYGLVTCAPCVGVLPLRDDGHVLLVRQFRYVAQRMTLEIPTGGVHPGEALEEAARRELREEAGVDAGRLRHLATYHTSKSIMDEVAHLYLGEDLVEVSRALEPTEEITVHAIPLTQALALVDSGEIVDSMSVIALMAAARVGRFRST